MSAEPNSPMSPTSVTRDRKDSGQATDDESGDEDVFVDATELPPGDGNTRRSDTTPRGAGGGAGAAAAGAASGKPAGLQKVGVRFAAVDQHAPTDSSPHSGGSGGSGGGGSAPGSIGDSASPLLAAATDHSRNNSATNLNPNAAAAAAAPLPATAAAPQQPAAATTAAAANHHVASDSNGAAHSQQPTSTAGAATTTAAHSNSAAAAVAPAHANASITIGAAPAATASTAAGGNGKPANGVAAVPGGAPHHPMIHTSKPAPPIPAKPPVPLRPSVVAAHAAAAHTNNSAHPNGTALVTGPAAHATHQHAILPAAAAAGAQKDVKTAAPGGPADAHQIIRPIPLASASGGVNPAGGADIDPSMFIKNLDTGETVDLKDAATAFPEVAMTLQSFDEQVARATELRVQQQTAAAAAAADRRPSMSISSNGSKEHSGVGAGKEGHVAGSAAAPPAEKEADVQSKKETLGFLGTLSSLFKSNPDKKKALPSNIVKTSLSGKKKADLSQLKFIQGTMHHTGPIWTVSFSHDGCYIATGGQDSIVRVWAVNGSPSANEMDAKAKEAKEKTAAATAAGTAAHETGDEKAPNTTNPELEVPASMGGRCIVRSEPFRMYSGHKADVIDLAWSKANFLLSASIDKTVRLWHVSRAKCLCLFQHNDFVTAVAFHPIEDKFFVSGSFDKKLRIWNIPEHRVVEWAQTANIITAATFSPNGKMAVAGLYNGQCVFYLTEGLKYRTQVDCRNRHGKDRKGKKVTGLQFTPDGKKLLITTNDSRIRLYDMDDYSLLAKYKGLVNDELQIKAYFSPDSQSLICGSENSNVYIWPLNGDDKKKVKKESYEYFKATPNTVTCALFFPRNTIHISADSDADAATITHMIVSAGYGGELKFFENRKEVEKPPKK